MQGFDKLPRWLMYEIAIPLTCLNLWLFYKIFQAFQTPFTILIVATLLSFLLGYPVRQIEKLGIKSGLSVALILLVTLSLLGVLGFNLLPILLRQLRELSDRLPVWLDSGIQQFQALDTWLAARHIPLNVTVIATKLTQMFPDEVADLPNQAAEIILGVADRLVEVLITIVFTLYLLLHGEKFWNGVLQWLPGEIGNQIRIAFQEQFRSYFVGQFTIALLMATALTIAFFVLKIPYWLVFGTSIGLLAIVPFGDTIGIFTSAVIISFKSVILGSELAIVALIIDQVVDNTVTPRILGNLIGLNPIWILLSLLIGSQLAGALGLILAVPLAGSLKRIFEELLQTQVTLPLE
ncbi:MAG: AI-2E family transporter [Synechococcales cyanobacterium C42_A2020_086]|jgi:predicted PurR-regulated permease PerM|nr:AI-2E family transporter [Synechococcales cyanobacterium C42_A2020_086]